MPSIIPSFAVKNPDWGCRSWTQVGHMKKWINIRRNKARGNYRLIWFNAKEK
jgi:hypothetical protein